jgi:ribonuclease HII
MGCCLPGALTGPGVISLISISPGKQLQAAYEQPQNGTFDSKHLAFSARDSHDELLSYPAVQYCTPVSSTAQLIEYKSTITREKYFVLYIFTDSGCI